MGYSIRLAYCQVAPRDYDRGAKGALEDANCVFEGSLISPDLSCKSGEVSMELVTKVRDAEHWVQVLESSEKKLVVVDVHKDWCGPCKIVEPSYKRLTTDIEHAERRVMFATDRKQIADVDGANAPLLEQSVKQHLPPIGNDDEEN
ncbi:uncharacterized protein PITG_11348 [Phytophthora infestans T30-4]|uniref:Thioredoxin domain-containing protein n=2 Tax=Phytophthora infestans TaxID=4787 RepID=D0NIL0_PHYIT|nr:uncharacterized protein PITG_11348 [Phytophthora infestans T30-4]EEY59344.1 conserved hypothetical protein [Phytophthora infestans T30-4]|eukprot:XP_002900954.1 conserved hypothetical protein [Phytophthora infestans T30-4]